MTFCRIMTLSDTNLWKRTCRTVTASSGLKNSLIWKRDISNVKAADDLSQKSKMFDKLGDRTEKETYRIVEETLNTFTKEDGVSITQVDLFG